MTMKGFAAAKRHKGGFDQWVHDEFKNVYNAIDGGADVSELKAAVEALETAVGKASGQGAGGIAKDVADLKTAVGDESTANSILGRIKALEDAS